MKVHWWLRRLVYLPMLLALLATSLFFWQGGFAAGHGRFDGLIVTLTFPGILFLSVLPIPSNVSHYDYLTIVVLPTLINTAIVWIVVRLYRVAAGSRSRSHR